LETTDITKQRAKLENITALPTVPGTFKRVSQIIGKPSVTVEEIAGFVSRDPALTTKILRMVNSAVYGFPGRISSVSHAIMLLGLNVVRGLLLGISVFEIMQQLMSGLWDHSLGCAVIARTIAEKKGVKDPEEVSIAALLHDIGKVILILEYQPLYEQAMRDAASRRVPIMEAERVVFQETHAAVGMWMALKWRFPVNLVEGIAYHHQPNLARNAPLETAIVHFSDILMRARGLGFAGDALVPVVHPVAFQLLALTEADILGLLERLENSLDASGSLTL
jgi:putative nucleotidyltransferase with HDIG domain